MGEINMKRILVVEDEPAISDVCRRVLSAEGFNVDVAQSGDVAQGMMVKKDYDLILVDIRTPVMSGKELYQYMKEKHPELARKVIFTTGDVISGGTQGFLEQSGQPFLPKPFTPDQLKAIVKEALGETEK